MSALTSAATTSLQAFLAWPSPDQLAAVIVEEARARGGVMYCDDSWLALADAVRLLERLGVVISAPIGASRIVVLS